VSEPAANPKEDLSKKGWLSNQKSDKIKLRPSAFSKGNIGADAARPGTGEDLDEGKREIREARYRCPRVFKEAIAGSDSARSKREEERVAP